MVNFREEHRSSRGIGQSRCFGRVSLILSHKGQDINEGGLLQSQQGRKPWYERSEADVSAIASQPGGLPSNVAATAAAVQWLPLVHSGGQLLELPALPTAAAGSAAAAADAQAERARDAVCASFHVAK